MLTKIHIRKDRYKFSSAHMTVFEDGTKENLHGHNYETELTILAKEMIPFSVFKEALEKVVAVWDEKVLLPKKSKYLKIEKKEKNGISFTLCKKFYSIPQDEVVFLETDNVTCEALSYLALENFLDVLDSKTKKKLVEVTLRVDESRGNGASTVWSSKT